MKQARLRGRVVWGWAAACPSAHGLALFCALCEPCNYNNAQAWLCSVEDDVLGMGEWGSKGGV